MKRDQSGELIQNGTQNRLGYRDQTVEVESYLMLAQDCWNIDLINEFWERKPTGDYQEM